LVADDGPKRDVKDLWDYVSQLYIHAPQYSSKEYIEVLIKTAVSKGAEKFRIVLKKEQFESVYQFYLSKMFLFLCRLAAINP